MTRSIVIVLTAVIWTLVAPHVRADTRVTVHDFYGPSATRLREDVVSLLERQSGVTIISKGQIDALAMKLGVDPFSPEGRIALARELQLSAWMTGVVKKHAGKLNLTVVIHDGAQHAQIGRIALRGRNASKLSGEIRTHLWPKTRRAILGATAPAPSSEVDEAAAAALAAKAAEKSAPVAASMRDDGGSDDASRNRRGESLRAFVGVGSPYRSLAYSEPVTSTLGDYRLAGAPMVDLNVAFHPARPFTDSWISWIGLDLRAQITTSTPSVDSAGGKFKSRYDAYHVGLRGRVPVGNHYISAFSGVAMNRFAITLETKGMKSPAPSVDYRMIRSGVGAEFALSDAISLGVDGAWLQFLSVGEIANWFPRASAGGVELSAFATYNVTPAVYARASAAYQRTFFDFNSKPGDKNVAGGATDQYLAMSVGAGVRL
jgi:hypothetical protein